MKIVTGDKHTSLFFVSVSDGEKSYTTCSVIILYFFVTEETMPGACSIKHYGFVIYRI